MIIKRTTIILAMLTLFVGIAFSSSIDENKGYSIKRDNGTLQIIPLNDNAVRIKFTTSKTTPLEELLYTENAQPTSWKYLTVNNKTKVTLKGVTIKYDSDTDQLCFFNKKGKLVLKEALSGRQSKDIDIEGKPFVDVSQAFETQEGEFLYGTGQFQDGYLNIKGLTRRLTQVNTQISVPFVLSSKGYGILWNNYGLTEFNPSTNSIKLQGTDEQGNVIEVNTTSTNGNIRERRVSDTFKATIDIPEEGDYSFLLDVGQTMARKLYLAIGDKVVIDMNNLWLPPTGSAKLHLAKGSYVLTVKGVQGDSPTVSWRKDNNQTEFHSPIASSLDYTVFVGSADEVVSSYRTLTGKAPIMPDYMLGYIHCRERYNTQEELLNNAKMFKEKNIPVSVIVQDWQYWGKYGWNAMKFDEGKYPNPASMVNDLHNMNIKLMLSVWSKVDKGSDVGKEMASKDYYIKGTDWVDFFNPSAAEFHWDKFRDKLLKPYDIDSWWFDATEPENDDLVNHRIGKDQIPGEIYRNVYPMKVIGTMYNGLIKDDIGRTPSILTRSAFSGMQKYNAIVWSGDVGNDMNSFKRQIAGGLNYVATGMPWWTYDAGGFFRPGNQYTDKSYQERMLRWIETSVFLPIMRVHGYQSNTEPWNYPEETQNIYVDCIKERYELLPYIKECAKKVSEEDYTIMRPLVFDFSDDSEALKQETEYMFGPKYLVCPITTEGVSEYKVYLPKSKKGWNEHYTGKHYNGGQYVTVPVTLNHIPVFERK